MENLMKTSFRKKGMLACACMFMVLLALMTGCAQPNTAKNLAKDVTVTISTATSRTIMPQDYPTPALYTITMTSRTAGINSPEPVDVAHAAEGATYATISQVQIGNYSLQVNAYSDEAKTKKIFTGSSDIAVTANGSNGFEVSLNVISSSSGENDTGTVAVAFDWSATNRTVTDVELLISDGSDEAGVLQFSSQGKVAVGTGASTLNFSKAVAIGKNQYAMFKLWNGSELIGETGVEILHVFLNMESTPTVAKNYVFTEADFQPAEGVKQVSVASVSDGSKVGLKIDWTNPVGCDHQVISWKLSGADEPLGSHTTASSQNTYTIADLTVNTEYLITITTYYASGLVSPAVSLIKTTAVPVASVSLEGIPSAQQTAFAPGASYKLSPVVASAVPGHEATDLGYVWESSDESIVKVMSDGSAVAQKAGVATVTVTTVNGNKSASVDVTVHLAVPIVTAVAEADGIKVSWAAISDAASYEVKRADGTVLSTVTADSSSVATYKDTALIAGNSYSYTVQAKASSGVVVLDSAVSTASTAVSPAQPTISIALPAVARDLTNGVFADTVFNLVAGDPALTISITPITDAVSYQWMLNTTRLSSSTEPYITVVDEHTAGLKPGVMDNRLTLVVTDGAGDMYSATAPLYYIAVKDTDVSYTGDTTIKTTAGAVQLTADVTPSNASIQTVTWSLVNPDLAAGICTLSDDGLFTALDTGSVDVRMTTHSGATKTVAINCVVPVKSVTIQPTTAQGQHFVNGQNGYGEVTLSAVVESATEGKAATDQSIVWSSSNSSVAMVDTAGKVTPVGAGTATITVKTNDGSYTTTYDMSVSEVQILHNGKNVTGSSFKFGYTGLAWDKPKNELVLCFTPTIDQSRYVPKYQWSVSGGDSSITSATNSDVCVVQKNGANMSAMTITCSVSINDVKLIDVSTQGIK
jgi:uncharacterized protein YjdB